MIYPGTSPMVGVNDPNSLDQRKQQLLKQLAGGQGIANNLSFGGSAGDAPGRGPSLNFNPFMNAIQHILGNSNAGQAGNSAVSGHPFFGGPAQNIPSNGQQSAAVTTGQAAGSAGIGGVAGAPAAAHGTPQPMQTMQAMQQPGGVSGIPSYQYSPYGAMQLFNFGGQQPQLPPQPILNLPGMRGIQTGF
jgi:hypothetical protein